MNSGEFRKWGKEMVDFIADYWDSMRDCRKPLSDVQPGYMRPLLPSEPPQDPEKWENIFGDLDKIVLQGNTNWHHPHFFAYYLAAQSYPAVIGDLLASGLGTVGLTWNSSPACAELELIVLDWLAKMLKLPEFFLNSDPGPGVGMIQSTATDSIFMAFLAARDQKLRNQDTGLINLEIVPKLVAYTSEEAHCSVDKGAMLSLVKLRKIPTDDKYALLSNELEKAIQQDINDGLKPFFVCATLGTTSSCAFDNLQEIGPICKKYDLYLHVDAAYAGTAFVCPEYRHLMNGIEFADSLNISINKMMLVNFDCSAMWYKNAKDVERSFRVDATYLKHENEDKIPDFRNLQVPLARGFRALKVWFVLRIFGVTGIQGHVRNHCKLTKVFQDLVATDNQFEITAPVVLGLVCFRLKNSNQANEKLCKLINDDRRIHLVATNLKEKYVLRFTVCSTKTTEDDVKFAWNVIKELAKTVEKSC